MQVRLRRGAYGGEPTGRGVAGDPRITSTGDYSGQQGRTSRGWWCEAQGACVDRHASTRTISGALSRTLRRRPGHAWRTCCTFATLSRPWPSSALEVSAIGKYGAGTALLRLQEAVGRRLVQRPADAVVGIVAALVGRRLGLQVVHYAHCQKRGRRSMH
eukprot:scaffold133121_cov54-Phaeocystis_antarctica.AAC.2